MLLFDPAKLWFLSSRLQRRGYRFIARAIKAYNFVVFRAVLPPEAELASPVKLGHFGMNVVVHPNVTIGRDVTIWHGVTLSVSDSPGSSSRLVIGDRVSIGAGAVLITPLKKSLTVCADVQIGANAVVSKNIEDAGSYGGVPVRLLQTRAGEN